MDIGLQQGRGGAICLYAGTKDVADGGEHGYRRVGRTNAPWQGAEGCDMALRRYRGRRGRGRAWISACREDVRAVAGAEGCDMALRRYRGRCGRAESAVYRLNRENKG